MNGKNILFIISMFLMSLIMENSLYAGHRNKDREECGFSALVRKCLSCFIRKQTFNDESKESLLEQDGVSFAPGFSMEGNLTNIPAEMLWEICYKLPPLDIIRLSLASKNLRIKIDEEFWESYIRFHRQEKWDHSTIAVKVAFAFSFFKEEKIRKAAQLGLPKAIKIIRKKEIKKEHKNRENSPYSSKRTLSYSYEYGRPFHLPRPLSRRF